MALSPEAAQATEDNTLSEAVELSGDAVPIQEGEQAELVELVETAVLSNQLAEGNELSDAHLELGSVAVLTAADAVGDGVTQ
jgi:hypothetical protein